MAWSGGLTMYVIRGITILGEILPYRDLRD